ncbi:MAG: hydroxymethylbilane synthase [Phycisphaerales bacterium]|nr:MAG: hydroxymethylbilane synthase [Phycisphaerales bacterium]
MRPVRIASRGSKLALCQANIVLESLRRLRSELKMSVLTVSTKGDTDKRDFLHKSDSQGLFTSEVESAVLDGRADIAVHSLKDMPTAATPGLVVAAIPVRESPADALVASGQFGSIAELPSGAKVGTSSLRRIAQLRHLRNDLECVPLRGNVETRVSKVASGAVDVAVIACAGLNRLALSDRISAILPPEQFVPAPAQGALAVQIRCDDRELARLVSQLDHEPSRIAVETERYILASMQGGCSIPLGVYAQIQGDSIAIRAVICDLEGRKYVKLSRRAAVGEARPCAEDLTRDMLTAGGREILERIRST